MKQWTYECIDVLVTLEYIDWTISVIQIRRYKITKYYLI